MSVSITLNLHDECMNTGSINACSIRGPFKTQLKVLLIRQLHCPWLVRTVVCKVNQVF